MRPTGSSPTPNSPVELGLLAPCPLCRPSPRSCGTTRRLVVRARYDAPLPDSRRAFRVLPFPCSPAPRTPAFRARCGDSGCYPPVGAPSLRAQWREGRGCHASSHGGSSSSSPPSASGGGVGADRGAVLVSTGDSLMADSLAKRYCFVLSDRWSRCMWKAVVMDDGGVSWRRRLAMAHESGRTMSYGGVGLQQRRRTQDEAQTNALLTA